LHRTKFPVKRTDHWRHSYDVSSILDMAAADVANQLPVPL